MYPLYQTTKQSYGNLICRIRPHVLMTIIKGSFYSPQTLKGWIKNSTDTLIRLIGGTTAKWSQIGAALTFLGIYLLWCRALASGRCDGPPVCARVHCDKSAGCATWCTPLTLNISSRVCPTIPLFYFYSTTNDQHQHTERMLHASTFDLKSEC